jgi:hypothetical protein
VPLDKVGVIFKKLIREARGAGLIQKLNAEPYTVMTALPIMPPLATSSYAVFAGVIG